MMKRIALLLMILMISVNFAYAEENECHEISQDINTLEGFEIPKAVPYNKERVNVYTLEEEVIGNIIIDQKVITSTGCGAIEDPSYNVYIKDKQTIDDIAEAESPVDEFNKKVNDKDIVIKGTAVGKKVKGFFTRISLKIAGWFS